MRIIFMGGHSLGKNTLKYLIEKGKNIVAVVTNNDDEWYRGVDEIAEEKGLLLYKNVDINSDSFINVVIGLKPDLIVVVNFQKILKKDLINIPNKGCINTHASLLPKYRGRAPLNWALIHGEKQVGVTVHFIETGIDTGDIIVQQPIEVGEEEYIEDVLNRVTEIYPSVVNRAIDMIYNNEVVGIKQDLSNGCYFGKRTPEDGKIDWNVDAEKIFNLIRAVSRPYPGAYTYYENNKVIIWKAKLTDQLESEKCLPDGYLVSNKGEFICVKAKNKNIMITEYEIVGKIEKLKEKHMFTYDEK